MSTLQEIGQLETPKTLGTYNAGQFFLHRTFGYRGLILFPWNARLYDRTNNVKTTITDRIPVSDDTGNDDFGNGSLSGTELKYEPITYYNTLIDARDRPHIEMRNDFVRAACALRYSGGENYLIPGLDHVSHSDILPYASSQSFEHELVNKLFVRKHIVQPSLRGSESLRVLEENNFKWLDSTDVHCEVTEGVRVTVIPFYVERKVHQEKETFWWRYCVRLENLTKDVLHLCEHHLRIFNVSGKLDTKHGVGVCGEELLLFPERPAFQYCSYVSLDTRSGNMWGSYQVRRENSKSTFEVRIPPCSLEVS